MFARVVAPAARPTASCSRLLRARSAPAVAHAASISTSHCVYASCRDATDSFRVIIPREAVGERCELMHEVFLFDMDIDLGDVPAETNEA